MMLYSYIWDAEKPEEAYSSRNVGIYNLADTKR
jgi:hypothetical protein